MASLSGTLAFLVLLPLVSVEGLCPDFTCKNGACTRFLDKCDGVNDCGDASDEDPAFCSGNVIEVAEQQRVAVHVQFKSEQNWIEFLICDESSCSSLDAHGRTSDGGLSYVAAKNCNTGGHSCTIHRISTPPGSSPFESGDIQFMVERRAEALAVWLQGEPRYAATVPITTSSSRLQLRPGTWISDLRVKFVKLAL
ncbi:low-density lipoprotein receptor-related protein 1B-like [Thrips palmi]|uniref:Low-density lipoprotein receptor-related protein 1B-like n=1 Tax=Thrips palmi TaxID=161013 RepID=A0A6P8Y584_THRPL|nr:low-density lipoprotein receptor-related protein 1B-like [Thrips palmi]